MKGSMNMFTNDQFKSLLIKTLERKALQIIMKEVTRLFLK